MRIIQQAIIRPHKIIFPKPELAAKYKPLAERILSLGGMTPQAPSRPGRALSWVGLPNTPSTQPLPCI